MELAITIQPTIENPESGDLSLGEIRSEVVLNTLSAEVAQRLVVRFNFFKGEWFADLAQGTPWFQEILGRFSDEAVRAVLSEVIEETEGVASLISLTTTTDNATRVLTLVFKARLEDGTAFSSTDYPAFVVGL